MKTMKTIYTYKGLSKQDRSTEIDDETALWLMRMCVGEGGGSCTAIKASTMLWALLNRWMLHPWRRNWPTFQGMVRAFSQPINPRWQKGGNLAKKNKNKPSATPARLRRRAWICELKKSQINSDVLIAAENLQSGVLEPEYFFEKIDHKRISNWASYNGVRKKYPHGVNVDGDWFFEDLSPKLIKGHVVVDHWAEDDK